MTDTIVSMNRHFRTLDEAFNYAAGLCRPGVQVQASRVYQDQYKKPRSNVIKLLGVERKAAGFCRRMEPDGQWGVEVEAPDTTYYEGGMFGLREARTTYHRFSAWYNRYLPYAYAMAHAEHDFKCLGIDCTSITSSYYGTLYGYSQAILDRDEGWDRFRPEDRALYQRIYEVCEGIEGSSLPFDAVFRPACVYLAWFEPKVFLKLYGRDWWGLGFVNKCLVALDREPLK